LTDTSKIRVLTVDDHPLLREGIAIVIEGEADIQLVAEAADGQKAIKSFQLCSPDVTLMNLDMPVMGGMDPIVANRREFPNARFVVLTTYQGDIQALPAFNAGASGYLLKNMLRRDLLDSIRAINAGVRRMPPDIAAELAAHGRRDTLTGRETEILRKVAEGSSNKIIASQLAVSEATIKAYMKSILAKLDANDRTHAVMVAMRRRFFEC
jgi:DNA-binding NarL/FixJ family response regulator